MEVWKMTVPTHRIVGVVDELGYLRCGRCVQVTEFDDGYVWDDSFPHSRECCDVCGRLLVGDVPATEVKCGDNVLVAGSVWKVTEAPYVLCGYVRCELDAGYGRRGRFDFRKDTLVSVTA
jgi:hypothetical protein